MTVLSESKGNELIKNIHDGIIKKFSSAKQLVDFDTEISAGLYTYALEEFGKLLLVKESKLPNNQYEIKYDWFKGHKAHEHKFTKAFDYLQQNKHDHCLVLTEGDFVVSGFYWRDLMVGLLADFEARLSIFYTDFDHKGSNYMGVKKVPDVNKNMLQNAIDELERATQKLRLRWHPTSVLLSKLLFCCCCHCICTLLLSWILWFNTNIW